MKTNHIINRFLRACESYERRFDDWEHSGCCLGCIFVVSVTTALTSASVAALIRTLLKLLNK